MRFSVFTTILTIALLTLIVLPAENAHAVSKEEWDQLNLFYGKEDLVITSTRHPKHISKIPENMEIVTSEDIERMNAHTVAEVLERVTGVFIQYNNGKDFGSTGAVTIQGSGTQMHVKVMIDGIIFNNHSEGYPSILNLPIGIVERIEIIKGPASSTWGSSLGGVINIITKSPNRKKEFSGKLQTSYGKENSQDHRLEFSGTKDNFGYYIFGKYQKSDGLVKTRSYENENYFTKFVVNPVKSTTLTLSSGLSFPEIDNGHAEGDDLDPYKIPTHWFSANISSSFDNFSAKIDISKIRQKAVFYTINSSSREVTNRKEYDDEIFMIKGLGSYEYGKSNTFVFGCDLILPASMSYKATGSDSKNEELDKTAYYINNTFNISNFTIVPGIRYDIYDYDSIKKRDFLSPSIGGVFRINNDTILRGTITKGFNEVPLEWLTNSSWGNADVESEEVISYQAGFETRTIPYIWFKSSIFYHLLKNKIDDDTSHDVENIGDVKRYGYEFEIRTLKVMNFMFSSGFSFSRSKYDHNSYYLSNYDQIEPVNKYMLNTGIVYEKREPYVGSDVLRIALSGKYIYWDIDIDEHDIIWDLSISKRLNFDNYAAEFFLTAKNIFNGDMYINSETNRNPSSWMECGLKLFF